MPSTINGLPAHVLLVHVVVVLVPLAALTLIASATWPAARRRLGIGIPIGAFAALVAVPITTSAGKWLRDRVPNTALVRRHAGLGGQLLPFAFGCSRSRSSCGGWVSTGTAACSPVAGATCSDG